MADVKWPYYPDLYEYKNEWPQELEEDFVFHERLDSYKGLDQNGNIIIGADPDHVWYHENGWRASQYGGNDPWYYTGMIDTYLPENLVEKAFTKALTNRDLTLLDQDQLRELLQILSTKSTGAGIVYDNINFIASWLRTAYNIDINTDPWDQEEEHTHTWGDWEIVIKPTKDSDGRMKRVCKSCFKTEYAVIPARCIHEWSDWTITRQPTCMLEGLAFRECKLCGKIEEAEIPKKEHNYILSRVEEPGTCIDNIIHVFRCQDCGEEKREEVNNYFIGHTFEIELFYDGTPKKIWCTRCGKRMEWDETGEHIAIDDFFGRLKWTVKNFKNLYNGIVKPWYMLYISDKSEEHIHWTHIPTGIDRPWPDLSWDGTNREVDITDDVMDHSIEPLYSEWVIDREATCTVPGLKHRDYTCRVCSEWLAYTNGMGTVIPDHYGTEYEEIPVHEHSYTKLIDVREPINCSTPGALVYKCEYCDDTTEQEWWGKYEGAEEWGHSIWLSGWEWPHGISAQAVCRNCHKEASDILNGRTYQTILWDSLGGDTYEWYITVLNDGTIYIPQPWPRNRDGNLTNLKPANGIKSTRHYIINNIEAPEVYPPKAGKVVWKVEHSEVDPLIEVDFMPDPYYITSEGQTLCSHIYSGTESFIIDKPADCYHMHERLISCTICGHQKLEIPADEFQVLAHWWDFGNGELPLQREQFWYGVCTRCGKKVTELSDSAISIQIIDGTKYVVIDDPDQKSASKFDSEGNPMYIPFKYPVPNWAEDDLPPRPQI